MKIYTVIIGLSFLLVASLAMAADGLTKHENFKDDFSNWKNRPHEKFSDGEKMFKLVKETLLKNYQMKKSPKTIFTGGGGGDAF